MSDSEDEVTERQFKVCEIYFDQYSLLQRNYTNGRVLYHLFTSTYPFVILKICLIGNSQVGKTSIVTRYTSDTFSKNCFQTVGVEFYLKRTVLQGNRHVTLKVIQFI